MSYTQPECSAVSLSLNFEGGREEKRQKGKKIYGHARPLNIV
jgi:hypothetical protein